MHSKCSSLAHLQLALVLQYFLWEGNCADTAIKVKSDTEQHNNTSVQIINMIHARHQRFPMKARCNNIIFTHRARRWWWRWRRPRRRIRWRGGSSRCSSPWPPGRAPPAARTGSQGLASCQQYYFDFLVIGEKYLRSSSGRKKLLKFSVLQLQRTVGGIPLWRLSRLNVPLSLSKHRPHSLIVYFFTVLKIFYGR